LQHNPGGDDRQRSSPPVLSHRKLESEGDSADRHSMAAIESGLAAL
jgi:hypothetical protein